MKTKKRAIRRVTCVPSLDHVNVAHCPEEKECSVLGLALDSMVTGVGSVDVCLDSVSKRQCKDRPVTGHVSSDTHSVQQQYTGTRKESDTFFVRCESHRTDPVVEGSASDFRCGPINSPPVQKTGQCLMQQSDPQGNSDLDVPSNFIDKGKRKMYEVSNETEFLQEGLHATLSLDTDDAELLCEETILIMHDEMDGVLPGHGAGPCASQAPGCSSSQNLHTFAAVSAPCSLSVQTDGQVQLCQAAIPGEQNCTRARPSTPNQHSRASARMVSPCNVNVQAHGQRQQSQVTMRPTSNKCRVPRGMPRRVRQGPPDTYIHMGRCDQICRYCNARFWYDERLSTSTRNRVDYKKCCNGGKVKLDDIVENLIELLDEHNELVQLFRTARDKMAERDVPEFKVRVFGVVGSRQHELPTGDSIGAIVFEGGPDVETEFDVVVEYHDHRLQQVSKLNASYMSMQFPLIFFFGEDGQMEPSSSIVPFTEPTSKAIVAETNDIGLKDLKETDTGKPIYVRVYRKWTPTNKQGRPILFCCMLIDRKADVTMEATTRSEANTLAATPANTPPRPVAAKVETPDTFQPKDTDNTPPPKETPLSETPTATGKDDTPQTSEPKQSDRTPLSETPHTTAKAEEPNASEPKETETTPPLPQTNVSETPKPRKEQPKRNTRRELFPDEKDTPEKPSVKKSKKTD
ncbi:hypothetical protein CTI12_AA570420 [Artemisia annua]|uniref:Helitron helicase-like domain-containing protein n=1 Tax=Artemisia annua TaxID=35608 RepID=A0A2U1KS50_ARTAN|nr:hypothetical protein CTI12_AA570420 [Artemisia annua]